MPQSWKPSASLFAIQERAKLLEKIRKFFKKRKVLEVDTPLLGRYGATALHIEPIVAIDQINFHQNLDKLKSKLRFLQTSPEYCMKRLLCCFNQDIFQLCKAFRGNEEGRFHNPEFTMLEWYRIGFNHHQLMQEVSDLLVEVLVATNNNPIKINKTSYRDIFIKYINIDPTIASLDALQYAVINNIKLSDQFKNHIGSTTNKDCQELLFNHLVEPHLSQQNHDQIWIIYNYPKEQAALAKIALDEHGVEIAERFEVYVNGIEIANGYHELTDATIQENRFIEEQLTRKKLNKPILEIDYNLIKALQNGMPNCSGVALGVDRLLMVKTKSQSIQEVMCFPYYKA